MKEEIINMASKGRQGAKWKTETAQREQTHRGAQE